MHCLLKISKSNEKKLKKYIYRNILIFFLEHNFKQIFKLFGKNHSQKLFKKHYKKTLKSSIFLIAQRFLNF